MPKANNTIPAYGGIDPGGSGGFALVRGKEVRYAPMPGTPLEIMAVMSELFSDADYILLEKVHSSPQMGVASAFTFGKNYGAMEMGLAFLEVPHNLVTPQMWQGGLGIPKATKDAPQAEHKEKLRATAQRLHPKLPLWSQPRTLGLQRSICDALLIAHFCQHLYKKPN
mgnify:CR=1 FL=1